MCAFYNASATIACYAERSVLTINVIQFLLKSVYIGKSYSKKINGPDFIEHGSPVAVLALQNWGCNAPKLFLSSRLPIPIRSAHQFMKLSNVKISSRIISMQLHRKQMSDSQAFRSIQWSNNSLSQCFSIMSKWGCKAQNWGCNCTPCSNVEPPLRARQQRSTGRLSDVSVKPCPV